MKKIINAAIIENLEIAKNIHRLMVNADIEAHAGQFVQLKLPSNDFTLRRPLGIASIDNGQLKMFYRVVGRGTEFLSTLKAGDEVNLIAPLGNSFNIAASERILLVGGGMGLAPLLFAAIESKSADILMGGRNSEEVKCWENEFRGKANNIFIATDDGSVGTYGFVTDLLPSVLDSASYDKILVCGPEIMMRKTAQLAKERGIKCQVSLEKRMACGLGACLSCSIDTIHGRRKVCKDGSVFDAEEVFYN